MFIISKGPIKKEIIYAIDLCEGCGGSLERSYCTVDIPINDHSFKKIALCSDCHKEVLQHGILT